jgi:hypothetical protein
MVSLVGCYRLIKKPGENMSSVQINSSLIKTVNYNKGVLQVELQNGFKYLHFGVPQTVALELINATSPGKYYQNFIMDEYDVQKTV